MRNTLALFALILAACPGAETTTDDTDTSDTDTPVDTGDTDLPPETYPATWDGVQQLIDNHCAVCHPATNGVDLRAGITDPTSGYVVPGDPDASYLWQVVSGGTLLLMPPVPDGPLPAETVQCIHDWIADGASFQ